MLQLHLDDARLNSGLQHRVVAFGLISIEEREFAHRLVELGAFAQIATDQAGITRLRMRTRQSPAAELAVDRKHLGVVSLDQRRELHVAQLAHIVLPARSSGRPAKEQIGGRLHQLLAHYHTLAMMRIGALPGISLQYRSVSLLDL